MTRKNKYPETEYFHYININPKNRITGDCTFRAIASATGKSWEDVVMEMAQFSIKTGYSINDKKGIEKYLDSIGWIKLKQPKKLDNTKYTGKEYIREFNPDCIICTMGSHHLTCIIDGKVNDIWDCSDGCVGNIWVRG